MLICDFHFFSPEQDSVVAFTVAHEAVKSYSPGERIEFNNILTNVGAGFRPEQNEFLCPTSGLYLFIHSSASYSRDNAITEIVLDGTILVTLYAASGDNAATSNSVVIHCGSGSRVYITCGGVQACRLHGTEHGYTNTVTFSGYLVDAD